MRGRAIVSILIGNIFGALWLDWAIKAFAGPDAAVWPAYAFAAGVFVVAVWRLDGSSPPAMRARQRRPTPFAYIAIVVGEIVALNLMAYALQSHGAIAYLRPAIGLVIGLHFFPLARLFGIPAMKVLGAVMVVAAVAAMGALALGLPPATVVGSAALINGLSLLATTMFSRRRVI